MVRKATEGRIDHARDADGTGRNAHGEVSAEEDRGQPVHAQGFELGLIDLFFEPLGQNPSNIGSKENFTVVNTVLGELPGPIKMFHNEVAAPDA